MLDRLTVWPLDSCLNNSSEMVSRSAGHPLALAALTCFTITLNSPKLLALHRGNPASGNPHRFDIELGVKRKQ